MPKLLQLLLKMQLYFAATDYHAKPDTIILAW